MMRIQTTELSPNESNLKSVCRLCARKDHVNLTSVFGAEGKIIMLFEKITNYTPFKVEVEHRICDSCIDQLNQWHSFIQRCLEAQNKLRVNEGNTESVTRNSSEDTKQMALEGKSSEAEACSKSEATICDKSLVKKTSGTETTPGRTYCIARWCGNNSKKKPGISLFRIPKDSDRATLWLTNADREDLKVLSIKTLHTKYLCMEHFTDDMFMNQNKKRLVWNALPTHFPKPDYVRRNKKPEMSDVSKQVILSKHHQSVMFQPLQPKPLTMGREGARFNLNVDKLNNESTVKDKRIHNLQKILAMPSTQPMMHPNAANIIILNDNSTVANMIQANSETVASTIITHMTEEPYINCEAESLSLEQTFRDINERIYPCRYCGEMFLVKSNLISHQTTYHAEHPVGCDTCGKVLYKSKSEFMEHVCDHHT